TPVASISMIRGLPPPSSTDGLVVIFRLVPTPVYPPLMVNLCVTDKVVVIGYVPSRNLISALSGAVVIAFSILEAFAQEEPSLTPSGETYRTVCACPTIHERCHATMMTNAIRSFLCQLAA